MSLQESSPASNLISFDSWLTGLNKTRITGYRWRKAGLIKTVNMFGRLYIERAEVAEFERRAVGGEFSREAKTAKASASRN